MPPCSLPMLFIIKYIHHWLLNNQLSVISLHAVDMHHFITTNLLRVTKHME